MIRQDMNIEFEELPRKLQHALEILVEWHDVIVYEMEANTYGFYVLTDNSREYITATIRDKFIRKRHKCFLKGTLPIGSLQIEILTLCRFEEGLGFSIELHDNDYGFLDNKSAPAFVHVLDEDELEIGLLDITGTCPKRVSEIKEFRPPHEIGSPYPLKKTPLTKYRKNLVKWANSFHVDENRWEWAQKSWKSFHEYKR